MTLLKKLGSVAAGACAFFVSSFPTLAACTAPTVTYTFNIAVTPNFSKTLPLVIDAFNYALTIDPTNFYSAGCKIASYNITSVGGPTDADFASEITGGVAGYDLLLSNGDAIPKQLYKSYSSLVVGAPFAYAGDTAVLYSSEFKPVDISKGLPSKSRLQRFSLPNPRGTDPIGKASKEILDKANVDMGWAIAKNLAHPVSDGSESVTWVNDIPGAYGFTGKSQICDGSGGTETYTGSYHYVFTPGKDYKTDIILTGIELVRHPTARSVDEEKALQKFIGFLTGKAPISVPTSDGTGNVSISGASNLTDSCFRVLP